MKKVSKKKVSKKKAVLTKPRRRISELRLRELDRRFDFVSDVAPEQTDRCVKIRRMTKQLAVVIARDTPECREQSLAITKLEEALHFAVAAIVRPKGDH